MAHVLNKLVGVPLEAIKQQLEKDAARHAEQGMFLEHIWQNAAKPKEIFFLFRVKDLQGHKVRMEEVYKKARAQNPNTSLPEKIFLEEV